MNQPKAPTPADPAKTAAAQTQSNVDTAVANTWLNNANKSGPLGSVTYDQTGTQMVNGQEIPTFTETTTLSPEQQRLYDQQTALGGQMNDIAGRQLTTLDNTLSTPLSFDGLPEAPTADRQQYVDALSARLQPELDRQRAALETKLANQGIMPGSEAYREAIALNDRSMNDAYTQSILNAGNYAQQEYGMGTDARNRAIQEQLTLRNQPINEIGALMSGGQVTMPQFQAYQGGNIAGTDVAGITQQGYQNQLKAYEQQMNAQNAMFGGIAGLAGTGVKAMFGGLGA
jgi:hypothetical protein